jgi:hypothetical protein
VEMAREMSREMSKYGNLRDMACKCRTRFESEGAAMGLVTPGQGSLGQPAVVFYFRKTRHNLRNSW